MAQAFLILHLLSGIILPTIPYSLATQNVQSGLTHDNRLVSIFMSAKGMVSFCFSLPSLASQQESPQAHPSTCVRVHIISTFPLPSSSNPAPPSPTQLSKQALLWSVCVHAKLRQSCSTLCDPIDYI